MPRDEDTHAEGRTTLAGVFAPDAAAHAEMITELATAGVTAFDSYDELLATDLDAVWLPVPIHLH